MKSKKILAALLAMAMVLSMVSITAFAGTELNVHYLKVNNPGGTSATDETTYDYDSYKNKKLYEIVTSVPAGDTIVLPAGDLYASTTVYLQYNITLKGTLDAQTGEKLTTLHKLNHSNSNKHLLNASVREAAYENKTQKIYISDLKLSGFLPDGTRHLKDSSECAVGGGIQAIGNVDLTVRNVDVEGFLNCLYVNATNTVGSVYTDTIMRCYDVHWNLDSSFGGFPAEMSGGKTKADGTKSIGYFYYDENCTFARNGKAADITPVLTGYQRRIPIVNVAQIGEKKYEVLADAIADAKAAETDEGKAITVIDKAEACVLNGNYDGISITCDTNGSIKGYFTSQGNGSTFNDFKLSGVNFVDGGVILSTNVRSVKNMVVENCVFNGTNATDMAFQINKGDTLNVNGLTIKGNQFKNYNGINKSAVILNGSKAADNGVITIEDNEIDGVYFNGIQLLNAENAIVKGNVIKNAGSWAAINLSGCKNIVLEDNTVFIKEDDKVAFGNITGYIEANNNIVYETDGETVADMINYADGIGTNGVLAVDCTKEKGKLSNGKLFAKGTTEALKYVAGGKVLEAEGNVENLYLIANTKDKIENKNLTDDEKVEIINNTSYSADAKETTKSVIEVISELPTEQKEEISVDKIAEIFESVKTTELQELIGTKEIINSETNQTESKTIARVIVPETEPVNNITVQRLKPEDEPSSDTFLVQAEGVDAYYFDIVLKNQDNAIIHKTSVPTLVDLTIPEGSNRVVKVIRMHDGIVSKLDFTVVDATTVRIASTQFSGFTTILSPVAALETGSAVLSFKEAGTSDNQAMFDIILTGDAATTVDRFESGEFVLTNTGSTEVTFTPADYLTYSTVGDLYLVNRTEDAASNDDWCLVDENNAIVLGTVTVTGVGTGCLDLSSYIMNERSDVDNLRVGIDTSFAGSALYDIKSPNKSLTINVKYNNTIEDNVTAYQDMKIKVAGLDYDETFELGSDASSLVSFTDDAYTLTIADKLVKDMAYTVTVEGAGYRTARYTVTMTDDKTLNFWNNVKDEATPVEVDKESSATVKNFLAGDIVKDNNINIYDLSAVVSYFGKSATTENNYAKYDLNRDGKIDSKDVAYVLVSWNN